MNFVGPYLYLLPVFCLLTCSLPFLLFGQNPQPTQGRIRSSGEPIDPGPRAGAKGAGAAITGLTANELAYFTAGAEVFNEIDDVKGTLTGSKGLGPAFNLDGCASCHAQPSAGGTSPALNPQLVRKNVAGALNPTEFLDGVLTPSGPVREMRRLSLGGGVQGLFTIKGRSDAAGCNLDAPDLRNIPASDRRFRIPTPVFGLGLIEAISDETIAANEAPNKPFGISGRANRSGNDGTVTRFGWKAQNKSIAIFAGEAYNVEQGVSNELFPNERRPSGSIPGCLFNATPEDHADLDQSNPLRQGGDVAAFANFMRFLAPPAPSPSGYATTLGITVTAASITSGQAVFSSIGCNLCHTPSLTTGLHASPALSNKPVNLFSDLLVHDVGTGDGITQGAANGSEFRTAPLWGVGQRLFFLHDGRASDSPSAIEHHNGEANGVVSRYRQLSVPAQQDLINFLRSL